MIYFRQPVWQNINAKRCRLCLQRVPKSVASWSTHCPAADVPPDFSRSKRASATISSVALLSSFFSEDRYFTVIPVSSSVVSVTITFDKLPSENDLPQVYCNSITMVSPVFVNSLFQISCHKAAYTGFRVTLYKSSSGILPSMGTIRR